MALTNMPDGKAGSGTASSAKQNHVHVPRSGLHLLSLMGLLGPKSIFELTDGLIIQVCTEDPYDAACRPVSPGGVR